MSSKYFNSNCRQILFGNCEGIFWWLESPLKSGKWTIRGRACLGLRIDREDVFSSEEYQEKEWGVNWILVKEAWCVEAWEGKV